MLNLIKFLFGAVLLATSSLLFAQKTIIHAGQVLDLKNNAVLSEQSITIENGKIVSLEKGFIEAKGSETILDLKNHCILPGLMDMHVHLEGETSPTQYINRYTLNEADIAFNSLEYARKTLMAGFTTVRDLGGSGVNIALRNAIQSGKVVGPRIFTAGKSIAPTGGHADPTNGMKRELMGDPGPEVGVINGPADARKAVRQQVKHGADLIKITATGGVLSVAKDGSAPQFQPDEIEAVVRTAKDFGIHVAAHAHGDEGMKRAINGEVHSIEHGTLMTESTMELMAKNKTWYVPTITAGMSVAEYAKIPGYYPAAVKEKAEKIGAQIQETFSKAYKKGVKIAFGTDAGVFPHGENYREFKYMSDAGMPTIEVLRSATIYAAQLLGKEKELGSLEVGFIADLIAVKGNPLENLTLLTDIPFVMKEGVVYKK